MMMGGKSDGSSRGPRRDYFRLFLPLPGIYASSRITLHLLHGDNSVYAPGSAGFHLITMAGQCSFRYCSINLFRSTDQECLDALERLNLIGLLLSNRFVEYYGQNGGAPIAKDGQLRRPRGFQAATQTLGGNSANPFHLVSTAARRKLSWFGHVCRHETLLKALPQERTLEGGHRRSRPRN